MLTNFITDQVQQTRSYPPLQLWNAQLAISMEIGAMSGWAKTFLLT